MSARVAASGRSTKKISSMRPLRSSSGGSCVTSLAVATRNTLALRSAIQVNTVPSMRRDTPPSLSPPSEARPFSISSIHSTHGRHRLGLLQRLAQIALGFAVKLVVEHGEVEPHQRHVPRPGDRFGGDALARALHAEQQHALGRIDAELGGVAGEGDAPQIEPALEVRQAADVVMLPVSISNSSSPPWPSESRLNFSTRCTSSKLICSSMRMACANQAPHVVLAHAGEILHHQLDRLLVALAAAAPFARCHSCASSRKMSRTSATSGSGSVKRALMRARSAGRSSCGADEDHACARSSSTPARFP